MKISISLSFLILALLILSCKNEPSPIVEDMAVDGNWTITSSKRNNRPTSTLTDGFFNFKEGNKMTTNILGVESTFQYSRNDNVIVQEITPEMQGTVGTDKVNYVIEKLTRDTIILVSEIRNFKFEFLGIKTAE